MPTDHGRPLNAPDSGAAGVYVGEVNYVMLVTQQVQPEASVEEARRRGWLTTPEW